MAGPLLSQATPSRTSTFSSLQQSRTAETAYNALRANESFDRDALFSGSLRAITAPDALSEPEAHAKTVGELGMRKGGGLGLKPGRAFERGVASWYGPGFHGQLTANGETFNQNELTAAHPTLPFGTRVLVSNARTGKQVVVRINDRGPFVAGRIIDLSRAAAQKLGMLGRGHDTVVLHTMPDDAGSPKVAAAAGDSATPAS